MTPEERKKQLNVMALLQPQGQSNYVMSPEQAALESATARQEMESIPNFPKYQKRTKEEEKAYFEKIQSESKAGKAERENKKRIKELKGTGEQDVDPSTIAIDGIAKRTAEKVVEKASDLKSDEIVTQMAAPASVEPPPPKMPPRNPAEEEPTDWRAWLSLLAPLATGAIVGGASGNTAGVSTAARASMAEVDRRDKLDAEIRKSRAKLLEKRKVASEKPSYQTIYDEETGKNLRYAVWDAGDGTLRKELVGVDKKPPESYTEVGYVDESGKPVVGTMQRSTGQKGPVLGGKPESPAASNQAEINSRFDRQKQFQIYQDFIKPTSLFNVKKANVSGISKAVDLLNSGSPLGASGVRNIIARNVLGEKGPLSDGDVTRLAGDPSAQALVARFYEKWVAGKLTEDDRKDAYAVLKIAMKLEREDALREANNVVKSSQALGYDIADPINKYVSGALKEMPEFTPGGKVTKQIRTKNGIFNVLEDGTLVPVRK